MFCLFTRWQIAGSQLTTSDVAGVAAGAGGGSASGNSKPEVIVLDP